MSSHDFAFSAMLAPRSGHARRRWEDPRESQRAAPRAAAAVRNPRVPAAATEAARTPTRGRFEPTCRTPWNWRGSPPGTKRRAMLSSTTPRASGRARWRRRSRRCASASSRTRARTRSRGVAVHALALVRSGEAGKLISAQSTRTTRSALVSGDTHSDPSTPTSRDAPRRSISSSTVDSIDDSDSDSDGEDATVAQARRGAREMSAGIRGRRWWHRGARFRRRRGARGLGARRDRAVHHDGKR